MIQRLQQKRNEEGFTLIELLIVIIVLGILAAIVVFAVGGITDKGETASNNTDISVLQSAEEAYFAKNTVYASETTLLNDKYLRTVSSKNNICLQDEVAATPAVELNKDYKVVASTATCPAGYTAAP